MRQSRIGGPKTRCSTSQSWKRGDDRAKQNAASSRNGTVGSSGSAAPIAPRATLSAPRMNQKIFTTEM